MSDELTQAAMAKMRWAEEDADELRAERDALAEQVARLRSELQLIADADPVDLMLDPQWAVRIAQDALAPSDPVRVPEDSGEGG